MRDKPINLNEMRAAKNGEITPTKLLESNLKVADQIERVVTIGKDENGYIFTGWSQGTLLEALGMLEAAKSQILNDMEE